MSFAVVPASASSRYSVAGRLDAPPYVRLHESPLRDQTPFHKLFKLPPRTVIDAPRGIHIGSRTLATLDHTFTPQYAAQFAFPLGLQAAQKPAEPMHTGLKALVFETASDFNAFPRRRSTWVTLGIGGGAAAILHSFDDDVNAKLVGSDAAARLFAPGKYIGAVYTQAGVAVGLYVIGRYLLPPAPDGSRTNKVSHIGFDMLRAIIVSQTLTQGVKVTVRRDRPDGECCAFPSGHASATFATASVLERHLGYRGSWPTFVVATYVATSRLHDNRHFLSDVVFGAALGISTGWTVVGRHGRSNFALAPVPVRGGMMVALVRR